jgi:hypothetical protein
LRISVSELAPVDDLVSYLRRCGCRADVVGHTVVEASPPERAQVDAAYLRMELDAYLRVWREMHPEVRVDLLGRGPVTTPRA